MHWVWLIIVGLIVGALGRALHPGKDPMGWILTLALGVVSLIIAGLIFSAACSSSSSGSSSPPCCSRSGRAWPRAPPSRTRQGLAAARERPHGRELPVVVAPDRRLDGDRLVVGAVGDAAARLAAPVRPRLPEPGRDRDDHAARVAVEHLELVALAHRSLVDVAADDQLGAGVDETGEHVVATRDRLLACAPRRADQLVVERDDSQRAARREREPLRDAARAARRRRRPTGGATAGPSSRRPGATASVE